MITLYIAPGTKRTYDYGTLLDTEHGVYWLNADGSVMRGGFEAGMTVEEVKARFTKALEENPGAEIQLVVRDAVTTSFDMNPHGLI